MTSHFLFIWTSWGHTPFKSPPIFFSIISLHLFRLPNTNTPPWRHLPPMCGMRIRFGPLSKVWKRSTFETLFRPFFIIPSFFCLFLRGMGDPPWKSGPHPLLTRVFTHWRGGICTSVVQCCLVRPNNNRYPTSFESTYKLLPSSGLDPGSGIKKLNSGSWIQGRIKRRIPDPPHCFKCLRYPALIRIL